MYLLDFLLECGPIYPLDCDLQKVRDGTSLDLIYTHWVLNVCYECD